MFPSAGTPLIATRRVGSLGTRPARRAASSWPSTISRPRGADAQFIRCLALWHCFKVHPYLCRRQHTADRVPCDTTVSTTIRSRSTLSIVRRSRGDSRLLQAARKCPMHVRTGYYCDIEETDPRMQHRFFEEHRQCTVNGAGNASFETGTSSSFVMQLVEK